MINRVFQHDLKVNIVDAVALVSDDNAVFLAGREMLVDDRGKNPFPFIVHHGNGIPIILSEDFRIQENDFRFSEFRDLVEIAKRCGFTASNRTLKEDGQLLMPDGPALGIDLPHKFKNSGGYLPR